MPIRVMAVLTTLILQSRSSCKEKHSLRRNLSHSSTQKMMESPLFKLEIKHKPNQLRLQICTRNSNKYNNTTIVSNKTSMITVSSSSSNTTTTSSTRKAIISNSSTMKSPSLSQLLNRSSMFRRQLKASALKSIGFRWRWWLCVQAG